MGQTVERVYVSTDRNAYVCGERVWFSLLCLGSDGRYSVESAVSYLELISEDGTALRTKAALMEGRGAGSLTLPASLPTGNYRLVAYTGTRSVSMAGSRLLSIYNPFSTLRVSGEAVRIDSLPPSLPAEGACIGLMRADLGSGRAILECSRAASLSLSVYRRDGLSQLPLPSIEDFLSAREELSSGEPEKDGEVIRGRVGRESEGAYVYLSSAGSPSDVFISQVGPDGSVVFPTGNIHGDRELVCEVMDGAEGASVALESPFMAPDPGEIPSLVLSESLRGDLLARKKALGIRLQIDTLSSFLPHREDLLYAGSDWEVYCLDDYVRFPTVQEVIREIVSGVRIGRYMGKPAFKVLVPNATENKRAVREHVLTLMDGVIISDINLILNFDAMLLDRVEISRQPLIIGMTPYDGVLHFVTKNRYVTALAFPESVRVVDFTGVSYPVAYYGAAPSEGADFRSLYYWDPLLSLEPGRVCEIPLELPAGSYRLVAEGMDEEGNPVRCVLDRDIR